MKQESRRFQRWECQEKTTPADIYSEATAHAVAGAGWKVGLRTRARAEAFLERFFREVKLTYGEESLKILHLAHPHVLSRVQQRARLLPFQGAGRDLLCHSFREKTLTLTQPD
jgi:hypothetical protein